MNSTYRPLRFFHSSTVQLDASGLAHQWSRFGAKNDIAKLCVAAGMAKKRNIKNKHLCHRPSPPTKSNTSNFFAEGSSFDDCGSFSISAVIV
ncbi:hypothetical protein NPIL_375021 [Nephila pilipes]|uniref:Uncharacterized protein n=1 Tax=Nephila pilipes TaxID=299642 RepID=A0A8X6IZ59_NEPPI|nr:hypothetical protein NPIL_375021 [Nephila pilipes]